MSWAAARAGVMRGLGFDPEFRRCQDLDLSYRLFQAGASFAFVDGAVVYHRNERTLAGLMREGWQHGFHAVRIHQKHRTLLRSFGHPVIRWHVQASLVRRLLDAARKTGAEPPELAFLAGKVLGGLAGSVRPRYRSP